MRTRCSRGLRWAFMLIRVQGHWWPGFESLIRMLLDDRDDRMKTESCGVALFEQGPLNIKIKVKVMAVFQRGLSWKLYTDDSRIW
jgi:hypothetical protein